MRRIVAAALASVVACWTPLSAQSGGFPDRPLTAGTVAAGDAGTSPNPLDAVFLNPARTVGASQLMASYLVHEETGLRGYALMAAFKAGIPVALSIWKYEAANLFDEELLAADPTLASLGVFTTGLDVAAAVPIGSLAFALGVSAEFQHTLAVDDQRFGTRVGVAVDEPIGLLGLSWTGHAGRSPLSDFDAGTARATTIIRPLRGPMLVQLGLEVAWSPGDDRLAFINSVAAGPGPLKAIAGWRWNDRQATLGITLQVERLALTVGRELGSGTVIGGLTALTFSMRW
jgi:hypothetical protein